ncbi:MAG TPA: thioredoxin family protein [Caldithrix abyssi]|uniref:Thioredoxin family protein n=1 Tax=Caldithrix abyssi TaxID=187145 RepID=A0A7V4WWH9_CALAY|nr:thioredoxin family protein [Caldithrix abyssi]
MIRRKISAGNLILGAVLLAAALAMALEVNKPAPDFTLTDHQGKTHSLSQYKGKYVVLEWINFDCPFVRKHYGSGNMQALQKEYTKKGVVWLSVCSSAPGKQGHFDAKEITKRLAEAGGAQTAYLIDAEGKVGRLYGAKTTPHMFIIDPEGKLIYNGAIDSIRSTDKDDIKKAENYVRTVLDAVLNGKEVKPFTTVPYGCSVKY